MAKAKPKSRSAGDETKARIIDATLETLKRDGIVGASARSIARTGDFNQALIFYHFGSVDDAIIAAVAEMSRRRMMRYEAELEQADSLPELIRIARALHADDTTNDNMTVLTQAFAGAAGDDEMGPKLYAELEPWTEMVAGTIERVTAGSIGFPDVPHRRIADAVGALFLGIELLDDLDPSRGHAEALFDALESLAGLVDDLLAFAPVLELMRSDRSGSP